MNEQKAKEILGRAVLSNGSIHNGGESYVSYINGGDLVELDGAFTAESLEAMAWWMRNMGGAE